MHDLAVILINWNTRDLTLGALQTLYDDLNQSTLDATVWVVDNASSDDSVGAIRQSFPQVNLIASQTNLGFGGGNNLALQALSDDLPRAVYLLNSDTRTHIGATETLFKNLMSLPQAGVVGAQLFYEDGTFQHGAFAFPNLAQLWIDLLPAPGRWQEHTLNGRYPRSAYDKGDPFEVDFTLGATMMLKREVIQQTGMFDEAFHMYCEEIDWAWRIRRVGWRIYCVPGAHVTHLSGKSTGQIRPQSQINLWQSRLLLFERYYSAPQRWLAKWIIRLGMWRKLRQGDKLPPAERDAYRHIIQLTRQ